MVEVVADVVGGVDPNRAYRPQSRAAAFLRIPWPMRLCGATPRFGLPFDLQAAREMGICCPPGDWGNCRPPFAR